MPSTIEIQLIVDDKGGIKIKQFATDVKRSFGDVEHSTRKTTDATEQLKTRHERLIAGAPRLRSALIAVGVALTAIAAQATAAIYGLKRLLDSVSKAGDQIIKLSRRTGASTEVLSALNLAAQLADASIEELGVGLRMLQNNAAAAAMGTGEARRAFDFLGISVRTSTGQMKTADELFFEVADKLGRMTDATMRTGLAMDIFGRSGAQLIPLLQDIAGRKKEVIEQARKMGIIITEVAAEAAAKYRDAITELDSALKGVKFTIGNQLIPIFTPFVKQMTETVIAVRQWVESNKELIAQNVELWLHTFQRAAERLIPVLRELYKTVAGAAYLLGLMPTQLENRIEQLRKVYREGTLNREDLREMLEATRSRIQELQRGLIDVQRSEPGISGVGPRISIMKSIIEEMARLEIESQAILRVLADLPEALKETAASAKSAADGLRELRAVIIQTDKAYSEYLRNLYEQTRLAIDLEEERTQALEELNKAQTELYKAEGFEEYKQTQEAIAEAIFEIRMQQMFLNEMLGEANAAYRGLDENLKQLNQTARESKNIFSGLLDILGAFSGVLTALGINIGGAFQRVLSALSAFQNLGNTIARLAGQTGQAGGTTGLFGAGGLLGRGRCSVITTKYKSIRPCPELPSYCAGVIISAL